MGMRFDAPHVHRMNYILHRMHHDGVELEVSATARLFSTQMADRRCVSACLSVESRIRMKAEDSCQRVGEIMRGLPWMRTVGIVAQTTATGRQTYSCESQVTLH